MTQQPTPIRASASPPAENSSLFQRRVIGPIMDILRMGCSPRKLAWSIAAGLVIGVNPLLGSTTLVSLAVACLLRLNLLANQIANHLVYPLQLLLFLVFIRIGDFFFHTGRLPLKPHQLFHEARIHPIATTRLLWSWEWHALIVWLVLSAMLMPILVALLTPALKCLLVKLEHEKQAKETAAAA